MNIKYVFAASVLSWSVGSPVLAEQQVHEQSNAPANTGAKNDAAAGSRTRSPEMIRNVQENLKAKGYNAGPADGVWGPQTQGALEQFQQAQGMPATGELDEQTLAILEIVVIPISGEGAAEGAAPEAGATDNPAASENPASEEGGSAVPSQP